MASHQEIKDVVGLGLAVAKVVESAEDGVTFGDVITLIQQLKRIQPALAALKSKNLVEDFKNLDEAGKAELSAWFNSELDLKNDQVEAVIEQAFVAVLSLGELVKLIKPQAVA